MTPFDELKLVALSSYKINFPKECNIGSNLVSTYGHNKLEMHLLICKLWWRNLIDELIYSDLITKKMLQEMLYDME